MEGRPVKYRTLGKTGMRVSVIGIGTWQFGGAWGKTFTEEEVAAILGRGRELGINLIDTAECYGENHRSETLIGHFLKGQPREEWIVATKFGHLPGWKPDEVRQQLEDSLRALQTDYVDLYQFHSGTDEEFDTPGLWEMLQEQVRLGKVRHLGISVPTPSTPEENLYQVDSATRVGAEAIQVVYNRLHRIPEEFVFPSCERQNLGVLARVPLASGFLSGKYDASAHFPSNDVRSHRDPAQIRATVAEVERIRQQEVPEGVPMAQWALAWCLKNPAVTCVIPGCKSIQQVEQNAAAADLVEP